MPVSVPKVITGVVVLSSSIVILLFLLLSSIMPTMSVDELMLENNPEDYVGKRIQLIGLALNDNGTDFILTGINHTDFFVTIDHVDTFLPSGFSDGTKVLCEGVLQKSGLFYYMHADKITTKCPSKY